MLLSETKSFLPWIDPNSLLSSELSNSLCSLIISLRDFRYCLTFSLFDILVESLNLLINCSVRDMLSIQTISNF
nr:hypothetical protein [Mycoplasmopsis bovis]